MTSFPTGHLLLEVFAVALSSSVRFGDVVRCKGVRGERAGGGDLILFNLGHCSGGSPDFVGITEISAELFEEGGGICGFFESKGPPGISRTMGIEVWPIEVVLEVRVGPSS